MKDRMCAITSTVHPLPNIRYCCVSLHSHLYQSGIVCNRAHSVGVRRLIIVSICTHGCVLPSFLALAINVHDLSVFILRKCLPPNPHIVPEKTIRLSLWTVVRQFVLLSVRGSSCWIFFLRSETSPASYFFRICFPYSALLGVRQADSRPRMTTHVRSISEWLPPECAPAVKQEALFWSFLIFPSLEIFT